MFGPLYVISFKHCSIVAIIILSLCFPKYAWTVFVSCMILYGYACILNMKTTCKKCGFQYKSIGHKHCCNCKKEYISCISYGEADYVSYAHCCKCNSEYDEFFESNHTC